MPYPPKLVPPLYLSLALWTVIILPWLIYSLPHNLQGTLIHNVDKPIMQRPDLEETIQEVQRILNQDPTLPRLTRGEIEELYEKVTREEYEKSLRAGDKVRADSMRALMLVLPFNTDNNTEENLQELFTRPPVTKVVDTYSSHQPIQFLTPSTNNEAKYDTKVTGQVEATTYKPSFAVNTRAVHLTPTTYHPSNPPAILYHMTTNANRANFVPFKPLATGVPQSFEQNTKPVQRFSSHYSAKNAEFLKVVADKKKPPNSSTPTLRPVAAVLHNLGIVNGNIQTRSRIGLEDYYVAESAPKPSIVSVADLKGVRGQSIGPQITPDAYSMFKPLNIGEEIRVKPEVQGYLTRFGIVGGRKRKAIKKNESSSTQNSLEPLSQESEFATAKLPSNHVKAKKGAPTLPNRELEKLLENLKELERLNVNPTAITTTTAATPTSTTATAITTTTSTTTAATTSLVTSGEPILVQPKKPRRRIDPNIDVNFANQGNHQTESNQTDELSKLLENLQELEKLKISPEKVLKTTATANKIINQAATKTVAVETPAPIQVASALTPQQQLLLFQQQAQSGSTTPDLDQLQKVLQQLQIYERNNAKPTSTTTTTTTTTTTRRPFNQQASIVPTDLWQLRKLLADDTELEKLFEQAKNRQQTANSKPINGASIPRATTTTTSTTSKPTSSVADLIQLQRYLAELEKATSVATTTRRTTTSSSTTTSTTTTTTPRPPLLLPQPSIRDYDETPKKLTMENRELQALINRVQQLERLNFQQKEVEQQVTTDNPLTPFMGFTTRNVKSPSQKQEDYRLPVNDFANLRTLYKQVEDAEKISQGEIEISTKATAVKAYQAQQLETATRKAQNFAQRIIDITNDTGSGSSLQEVNPNDFVQLQKLLSKVQELERVRINLPTANPRHATKYPNPDTAASQRTQNVRHINEAAHIVYPTNMNTEKHAEEILNNNTDGDDLKLDFPVYKKATGENKSKDLTSSEELKDLVYSQSSAEEKAYKNLQPPMIHKSATKDPPRFVASKSPQEIKQTVNAKANGDLEEIQKLLNNAQELKNLGVSLPKELTQQLESKFSKSDNGYAGFKKIPLGETGKTYKNEADGIEEYLQRFGLSGNANVTAATERNAIFTPTTASSEEEELSEKTAVFSLTTVKSLTPRPPKTTTTSSVELPVFSATKIIEAAIKRAANRIGVSTEGPKGFSRREDIKIDESTDDIMLGVESDSDLMTDFSEINYQLAAPEDEPSRLTKDMDGDFSEMNYQVALPETNAKNEQLVPDLTENVDELQRLIKNLQELKSLNLSSNDKALLREADLKYLENLKNQQTASDETIKSRRQSDTSNEGTTSNSATMPESSPSSTTESSRIQLNLSLDDNDAASVKDDNTDGTTTATATTTEESRNGSLSDLEDSFGPNPITESPPPPKKKNGFYFLADWNSFLEVGDGDDQVIVRLSPKIGDPRLFLPVKIP